MEEINYDLQEGYYRTRAYKNGPWVPIRVWLQDGERDVQGNLISDQRWMAEENRSKDPFLWKHINPFQPNNVYWQPITEDEFQWIIALNTL